MLTTRQWHERECPIVVFYGSSGVGKTTLVSTIFNDDDYYPVLYLDLDEGAKTISNWTSNPKACDYRSKSKRPKHQTVFEFAAAVLIEAETSKHKAIVIEGLTKFRDNLAGTWKLRNPEKLKTPRGNMYAYQEASSLTSALITGLSMIQDTRKMSDTGCPIIVTLNPSENRLEQKNAPPIEFITPKLSENLCEDIMSRADVFAELVRPVGMPLRLIATRGKYNKWRKARNPDVAKHLSNLANPAIDEIFDTWVKVEQGQIDKVVQELDTAYENTAPTDNPDNSDKHDNE